MGAFVCWLAVRVLEMHRILKPTGSIYLHIDHTAHAYVKAMMDAVFGRGNFRNEIVWGYRGGGVPRKAFARKHDTLLFYAKSSKSVFYPQYTEYSEASKALVSKRGGVSIDNRERDLERGATMPDWWTDINALQTWSPERNGYPTQKPLALYERMVKASSSEGDMVLDPFAGCATTCVVAERLGRSWVGIDINREAEQVIHDRLQTEIDAGMAWGELVTVRLCAPHTKRKGKVVHGDVPMRTDDGKEAAPELILVSPKAKGPTMTARELRRRLILRDGQRCQGCGWKPPFEDYLEGDHMMPKSKDGKDSLENRALLCGPCNGVKGNRLSLAELRERRVNEGRMMDKAWDARWYAQRGKYGTVV